MIFDPCNHFLKIWDSIWDSNSQDENSFGSVKVHSLTLFCTLLGTCDVTPGFPFWPTTLQALALVASPRLKLRHHVISMQSIFPPTKYNIGRIVVPPPPNPTHGDYDECELFTLNSHIILVPNYTKCLFFYMCSLTCSSVQLEMFFFDSFQSSTCFFFQELESAHRVWILLQN